jgi:hypothetical protein
MTGALQWVIPGRGSVKVVALPTELVEKQRAKRERDRLYSARSRNAPKPKANQFKGTFIAWDGEGPQDAGYALFGNSEGDELCSPYLPTVRCLELLLEAAEKYPGAIHIWFGGNYDVSMILKDCGERVHRVLKHANTAIWKHYKLKHIPHKWFEVEKGGVNIKIYDIHSFFGCSYIKALEKFHIGELDDMEIIVAGKRGRAEFLYSEIDEIRTYWRTELRLMPLLASQLRSAFDDAGYVPKSWYGPGAIARLALRRHNIKECMQVSPPQVLYAALRAFAGGRFEQFLGGHANRKVYIADLNSAYPYFATQLPNLARGKWRHAKHFEKGKFGVYHIDYKGDAKDQRPHPLFRRMPSGEVAWPHRVTGWYWTPEAELVENDPRAKFLEGWVFDEIDSGDRPFAWLADYYSRRLRLKRMGSAAEYTFKLIINSVYGQLAQRAGWNRKRGIAPTYHQIEWAGYITSGCRAEVYKVALSCQENLVSIDTDGIVSLAPFEGLQISDKLGDWDIKEYDAGIFWQSGIYALKSGDDWPTNKTRGVPANSYTYKTLLDCLERGEPLRLSKHEFVTYRQALLGDYSRLNTWEDKPHEFRMGGTGKRYHNFVRCQYTCNRADGLHRILINPFKYDELTSDPESVGHYLPWMKHRKEEEEMKYIIDDVTLTIEGEEDWEWMTDMV